MQKFATMICALISVISILNFISPLPADALAEIMPYFGILGIAWFTLELLPRIIRALIRDEAAREIALAFIITIGLVLLMDMSADISDKDIETIAYVAVVVVILGTTLTKRGIIRYARKKAEKENGQNLEKV